MLIKITLAAVLNFIIQMIAICIRDRLSHNFALLVYRIVEFLFLACSDLREVLFQQCYTIEPTLDVIDLAGSGVPHSVCGCVSSDRFAKSEASICIRHHMVLSVFCSDVGFDAPDD
jgi:hypothetical protein